MEISLDLFKDLISCQLCQNRMTDPRCLPCLHAFCFSCLLDLSNRNHSGQPGSAFGQRGLKDGRIKMESKDSLQCPTCRTHFEEISLRDLPQDFKVVQIIEKLQQKELTDSVTCFEHKKKLELFCTAATCFTPICYKCSITSHQNHEVAELQDHVKSLIDKLSDAERQGQQTVDNINMFRSREVRLKTLGDKLKHLVESKMKNLIIQENLKTTGPTDVEMSPENGTIQVLNRLQLRLLEVKERIGNEGRSGFMSSSAVQMRDLHETVVRTITDLNNECFNALASVKAKQMTAIDVDSFSRVVRDLLEDGVCGEYEDHRSSALAHVVQTELPNGVDISPSGSRKSLDTDSLADIPGMNLSRHEDSMSAVSSTAAGSDLISAAMQQYHSMDTDAVSVCSSSKDSPLRRAPAMPMQMQMQGTSSPNSAINHSQQSVYSEVRNNAQVILRFQVVNPTFDKFTDIRDCALLGEDFAVIDKRNEWIKSFDISVGRYIGTNNKGFTATPVGVHTLTNTTMLLVEENESQYCDLYFVDKDLIEKSPFRPELPVNERIHDVCTSPTGQIILSTKSMNVYEQHAITSEFGTRMSKWRETRFNLLFNANFMISHMAVSATGFIALGNAEDNLIYLYDRNGRHKWKFPVRENTSFKRLKQINFDLAGNLITVDNYYQQVQVISRQGKLIRVLHGRALQFARPICAVPKGDNQIVVMSEFGSVVVIEKYL